MPTYSAGFRDYEHFFLESGIAKAVVARVAVVTRGLVFAVALAAAIGLYCLWSCCTAVVMVEKMAAERAKIAALCGATARYISEWQEIFHLNRPSSEGNT